jgi:hypothetical protein
MSSQRVVGYLLTAAVLTASSACLAQGPATVVEAKILERVGNWLVTTLASYAVDKTIDMVVNPLLAKDNEKKIRGVETHLQTQIDQGAPNQGEIRDQLAVAREERRILQKLLSKTPSRKELAKDRAKLESDLTTIRSMLAEHEKRLDEDEQHLADNDRRLSELENEHRGPLPAPSPAPGKVPSPNPPQAGGRLTIEVRGRGNLIRLRVATHPVYLGTFRLKSADGQADYSISPEALAVIELFAPASRISMPQSLVHQVQILSHGFSYQTQLY